MYKCINMYIQIHVLVKEESRMRLCNEKEANAGRRTKFAPGTSLRFSELFLGILLSEFRFTVFFPLGCGVDS